MLLYMVQVVQTGEPADLCVFDRVQILYQGALGVIARVAFGSQHHLHTVYQSQVLSYWAELSA